MQSASKKSILQTLAAGLIFLVIGFECFTYYQLGRIGPAWSLVTQSIEQLDDRFYVTKPARRHSATVTYDFILRYANLSVDGVRKPVYTVNGEFPGPTINVQSGDTLIVNVNNQLEESTSLHWHGLRHEDGRISQDGAVGVTQCPIPPKSRYSYRFQVSPNQAGTFWWHSHHVNQRADGLYGALIVHERGSNVAHSSDELRSRTLVTDQVVVMVGDWYHRPADVVFNWYMGKTSRGKEPVPDSVLFNGRQRFECSRSVRRIECDLSKGFIPRIHVKPDRQSRLRFVNVGSIANLYISIDGHQLEIIEADGHLCQPIVVDEFVIAPGQRYSVILQPVNQVKTEDSFWIRSRVDQNEFKYPNPALDLDSKAILVYGKEAREQLPTTKRHGGDVSSLDALTLIPLSQKDWQLPVPTAPPVLLYVSTLIKNANGLKPIGYINRTSWQPNVRDPLLSRLSASGLSFRPERELVVATNKSASTVLDIIVNNLEDGHHPFHLHGHSFWPLHTYESTIPSGGRFQFDKPVQIAEYAPLPRDTFLIPQYGHAVFRVNFDSPGLHLFHCHVLVHQAAGMAMVFDVRSADISPQEIEASKLLCPAGM